MRRVRWVIAGLAAAAWLGFAFPLLGQAEPAEAGCYALDIPPWSERFQSWHGGEPGSVPRYAELTAERRENDSFLGPAAGLPDGHVVWRARWWRGPVAEEVAWWHARDGRLAVGRMGGFAGRYVIAETHEDGFAGTFHFYTDVMPGTRAPSPDESNRPVTARRVPCPVPPRGG